MNLLDIKTPDEIKSLSQNELEELAKDIRSFLIQSISKTGGHLSSNLGVVELTIAMHYVFNPPKDKILFDVGHQCYTHKILTGRAKDFPTLRRKDGISGFQKRCESVYDCWEAGHSSTSLSAALGFAIARDIKKEDYEVVALIGDGAISSGMSMEALNDLGAQNKKVIIIFNDNNMSISKNHGGIEKRISSVRTSKFYRNMKSDVKSGLGNNKLGNTVLKSMTNIRDYLKDEMIDAPFFKEFNLDYLGPIDGHNIHALINAFEAAKEHSGPIVVHTITQKGKGYSFAENDVDGSWHGVSPFCIETGRSLAKSPKDECTWSEVISKTLEDLAQKDEKIVAITPAMAQGSKLLKFQEKFPDRFFDCGIAEQHAITMAAGMACGGIKPFVSVYSSFLQRAYDQINHDVARMNLPVVIGIDRAGLVGDDGETHQGVFDISMLRSVPNIILSQPKDALEAQNMLYTAFQEAKPFCIRYPRGYIKYAKVNRYEKIDVATWTQFQVGNSPKSIVITYGNEVDRIIHTAKENDISLIVVNARFFKPIDTKCMSALLEMHLPIIIFETDCKIGSLSSAIFEFENEYYHRDKVFGIGDHFVQHGSIRTLRIDENIHIEGLFKELENV